MVKRHPWNIKKTTDTLTSIDSFFLVDFKIKSRDKENKMKY